MLFDTGPEEMIWDLNAKRVRADIATIERIHLSHWHRDHSGGMLKAISMIRAAKAAKGSSSAGVTVDLHPSRPKYRGIMGPVYPISLEPDPTFDEIEAAGATVVKNSEPHLIMDDMFLVSGEIPRVTSYETGLRRGIRFNEDTRSWEPDELVRDERFLMCNVKGRIHNPTDQQQTALTGCYQARASSSSLAAVMQEW